jgi:Trypsin
MTEDRIAGVRHRVGSRDARCGLGVLVVLVTLLLSAVPGASASTSRRGAANWPGAHLHALASYRRAARRAAQRDRARAAIVGGARASAEQFPWQVAVLTERDLCSGEIVGLSEIVTAGHCVVDPETGRPLAPGQIVVIAGSSNFSEVEAEGSPVQKRLVGAVRVHPYFSYAAGAGAPDDIAVLDLTTPLNQSASVAPIALPTTTSPTAEGTPATVSGFGAQSAEPEQLDHNLYSLATTVGFSRECGEERANAVFVCASTPSGTICLGDSGGPLVTGSTPTLIGVVDTVRIVGGQLCVDGAEDGFANVTAPEILDFIDGSETPPVAPRGGGAVIRGVLEVGKSLSCEPGSWTASPTFTYGFADSATGQLLQQGASSTYALTSADRGRSILCDIYATNAGGTGLGRTPGLGPIEAARSITAVPPPGPPGAASPVPSAGVLGSKTETISRSRIAALLKKALTPARTAAKIASVVRSGGATVAFDAPEAGSVTIDWYRASGASSSSRGAKVKPLLVASGHKAFSRAGASRIAIRLTSAGKHALRGHAHVALTATGTFTSLGLTPVTVGKSFVLPR